MEWNMNHIMSSNYIRRGKVNNSIVNMMWKLAFDFCVLQQCWLSFIGRMLLVFAFFDNVDCQCLAWCLLHHGWRFGSFISPTFPSPTIDFLFLLFLLFVEVFMVLCVQVFFYLHGLHLHEALKLFSWFFSCFHCKNALKVSFPFLVSFQL